MAIRPVFVSKSVEPFYDVVNVEFKYFTGFSMCQNRKTIKSLHEAFYEQNSDKRVLEISSKSPDELGVKLSAFNLSFTDDFYGTSSVECAYQGGKIFTNGGPYTDLFDKTSREAKKDLRLYESGAVIGFRLKERTYMQSDTEVFYSWLYIKALMHNTDLADTLLNYDAFTDIVFSPKKGVACQARSAAIFVGMKRSGVIDREMKNIETFISKHFITL